MFSDFFGNQICCGTYAFLNLTGDSSIDKDLFEISTSVPFGIVHKRYPKLDHLLTPFCDPNMGLDRAIAAWGYSVEHHSFASGGQAARFVQYECPEEEKVMVGPVDMGRLYYQPLVSLYRRLDHYIVVEKIDESFAEILDSEGIICEKCSYDTLGKTLSVRDIVEAQGRFHVRKVKKEKAGHISEIIKASLSLAEKNIAAAVLSEEGKEAFFRCSQFLQDFPVSRWKVALLYDLSYIMQRKLLHKKLGENAVLYGFWGREKLDKLQAVTDAQIRFLGEMFTKLKYGEIPSGEDYRRLDRLEEELLSL